jgi:hypothetical protein
LIGSRFILLLFSVSLTGFLHAQHLNNLRERHFTYSPDTIHLDSLSIIPGSEIIYLNDNVVSDTSLYTIDYPHSLLYFKKTFEDTLKITYRIFPYNFARVFQNKDSKLLQPDEKGVVNPFLFRPEKNDLEVFNLEGLNKNGSISRGMNFGNTQDLSVTSHMNLQLAGKINENVSILAAITDNNIPIQPDGNTHQLQDFDQVYIQVFDDRSKLTAGDFQLSRPNSYFMNFYKRAQGGHFATAVPGNSMGLKSGNLKISSAAAVSKGKFARNMIQGMEGIQGPYRLTGAENETFIIVLSGTEAVFIDGVMMKRGQEHDYIIDYNTAELTFTSKQLITKDKRIVIEFQYAERNFARSLYFIGTEYEDKKLRLGFNFYSEQDAKNQPLQQDLDPEKKQLLASVGDSIRHALYPNIDSVAFTPDQVLYKMIDTTLTSGLTFDSVFVYSTDPANAYFRLGFSNVGKNRGNYIQKISTANGKVFEWVAPINGIPQGSFEPVTILATPKKTQMLTLAGDYKVTENTLATFEIAMSDNDINTFSSLDYQNNKDIGFRLGLINKKNINPQKEVPLTLTSTVNYEQVNKNFTRIERFRPVEFERDWNILDRHFKESQHITSAGVSLNNNKGFVSSYNINVFNTQTEYNAFRNIASMEFRRSKYEIDALGSFLASEGFNMKTQFLRHRAMVKRKTKFLNFGLWEDYESNNMKHLSYDSLLFSSYDYWEWEAFAESPDTSVNKYAIRYRQRKDFAPFKNEITNSTLGESVSFDYAINKNRNSILKGNSTYRRLQIVDTNISNAKPEETILNRVEYSLRGFKGAVTSNTFLEIGSGLELKREFIFIEVPAGQGVYAYIGDLNDNGVKDINEFEIAPLPDLARYIKVFTPTNEYVRVYSNQFNQVLNLTPAAVWDSRTGFLKFLSKFSNQSAYRIDRRTGEGAPEALFNPFYQNVDDSLLITLNSSFRNTVFLNRTNPKAGVEYSWQDNRNKSLLVNGFDSRTNIFQQLRSRWNITKLYMLNLNYLWGRKTSDSEIFTNRNFIIDYREVEPRFTYQPGTAFRLSFIFKMTVKKNLPLLGGEHAVSRNMGTEIKYNVLSKGSLLANVNYIINTFNAADNTLLAFEMLEGLQVGKNIIWSLSYQRNLSANLQLNLNYTGRTSETAPAVHTGGVQVRAFF